MGIAWVLAHCGVVPFWPPLGAVGSGQILRGDDLRGYRSTRDMVRWSEGTCESGRSLASLRHCGNNCLSDCVRIVIGNLRFSLNVRYLGTRSSDYLVNDRHLTVANFHNAGTSAPIAVQEYCATFITATASNGVGGVSAAGSSRIAYNRDLK